MAGKTLIGGTAYTIKGGKTKIDGTAYSIKQGKTKIDGTAYDIKFESIPTFAKLFATAGASYHGGQSRSTVAKMSLNVGNWGSYTAGWTCYAFVSCGSSLEISRLELGSSSITQTQLSLTAASDSDKVSTYISGKSIYTDKNIYGGRIAVVHFNSTYSTDVIDYMFQNGWKSKPKYYYNSSRSSTSLTSTNTRIATSTVTGYGSGVIIVMFRTNSYSNWSVSLCTEPLTPIKAYVAGVSTRVALVEKASSNVNYLYPSEDGSTVASAYSYTMARLYEDW